MNKLLWLLLAFLFPHAEPGEPAADDTPAEDAPDDAADEAGDDELDASDDAPADDTADVPPPTARTRTPAAPDRSEEAIRVAREAQEAVQRLTPPQRDQAADADAAQLADAQRRLDAGLITPEAFKLEKWQIESNQALRFSQRQSQQALFQAQDTADKSMYAVKAATNPLYAKYEKQVEEELGRARSKGANPPREMVLDLVLGKALREGNFKAAKAAADKPTIARGRTPGARSDTSARAGASEREKRNARLAKTYI